MDCKKAKKWYNTKKMKRNEKMKLIASSSYLPNKIVMNKELSEKLGVTEEFIEKRTGIKQRFMLPQFLTASWTQRMSL